MQISSWGNYPRIDATVYQPKSPSQIRALLCAPQPFNGIARGLGRSYGDSALASYMLAMRYQRHILAFDAERGSLRCAAGLALKDLVEFCLPRGFFLPVTPGSGFVSVGGAIAADVHGKNHHGEGSFCDHLHSLTLMLASGELLRCSDQENSELFRATCGGMGLTGVIVEAELKLRPVGSAYMMQSAQKAANLEQLLALLDSHRQATYSAAWLDCQASGEQLGRALLFLAEHGEQGDLNPAPQRRLQLPFFLPNALINSASIAAVNGLYYRWHRRGQYRTALQQFFYPLDRFRHWNRIYGHPGFTQYQFVLPREAGLEGMRAILQRIADSRRGSFFAMLKALEPGNANLLSFPIEGYTLAVDFKLDDSLLAFLDQLDEIVLHYGGRLYLAKDVRMSEATFKQSYPNWEQFAALRSRYGATAHFNSLQSQRLGL